MNDVDKEFEAWWDTQTHLWCLSLRRDLAKKVWLAARAPSPPAPQDVGTRMAEKMVQCAAKDGIDIFHPDGDEYRFLDECNPIHAVNAIRRFVAAAINAAVREENEACQAVAKTWGFSNIYAAIRARHPKQS